MGIGILFLVIAILLLLADGGELMVPIFVISLTFVDLCFVVLMTVIFSSMAKPQKVKLKSSDNAIKTLEYIAEKKWGRKRIIQEKNIIRFIFDNKYKDWLATPIELVKDRDVCILYLPSAYIEDVKNICSDN